MLFDIVFIFSNLSLLIRPHHVLKLLSIAGVGRLEQGAVLGGPLHRAALLEKGNERALGGLPLAVQLDEALDL